MFVSPYVYMAWCLIKHRMCFHGMIVKHRYIFTLQTVCTSELGVMLINRSSKQYVTFKVIFCKCKMTRLPCEICIFLLVS
jgi:hypothetical protein